MNLPHGCLSVFSGHLDEASADFLSTTHPFYWPFPGGTYGRYQGWFCECEPFDPEPSMGPFPGSDILAVFEFAKSQRCDWVMFHESGKKHRRLKVHRKLEKGFDPFLYGLWMKHEKEDWRRECQEWLASLSCAEDIPF